MKNTGEESRRGCSRGNSKKNARTRGGKIKAVFDKWNWGEGDAVDGLDTLVYHGKQVNFMDGFFCPEVVRYFWS